jgi:hypothetical protein
MSQACLPLSFVLISILPAMNPIAVCLRILPLPYVRITYGSFPNAITFLHTFDPFTIVDFAILPIEYAFSMSFSILILTLVSVTICKPFKATTMPLILFPFSFINSPTLVDNYTTSTPLSVI